jgi:methionyl-tRNA synthetase
VLVLCALPYTNAVPHIGNIVGSHLPADIFARYCRLRGKEVLFIGGADENGTPTSVAAQALNVTPQALTDVLYRVHARIYEWFRISYDNFSRTSLPLHAETTQAFFEVIHRHGYISEGTLRLPYCAHDRLYLPDRYVEGTCPHCGYEGARGDQCERCTRLLDPDQLVDPSCKICGRTPQIRPSRHLFLELASLAPQLEVWIRANRHWRRQVTALAMGWINEGLKRRCITRDLAWGVPVTLDGYTDKVFYVWFDAPVGYLTFTKERVQAQGRSDDWRRFWHPDDGRATKIYNFIGKDNIPFHTIFWPAMLFAHAGLKLPYNVIGLQFCNYEGEKISKSRSWGVFCERILDTGVDADVWRYYLTYLIPETKDTDFKWEDFVNRVNAEYVGNVGNFIHRTATFVWNYFDGALPAVDGEVPLLDAIAAARADVGALLDDVRIRDALAAILRLSDAGNRYFQASRPWDLVKGDAVARTRCVQVLQACLTLSRSLAILLSPFIPKTAERILRQLNLPPEASWSEVGQPFPSGHAIRQPERLFTRLTPATVESLKATATVMTPIAEFF